MYAATSRFEPSRLGPKESAFLPLKAPCQRVLRFCPASLTTAPLSRLWKSATIASEAEEQAHERRPVAGKPYRDYSPNHSPSPELLLPTNAMGYAESLTSDAVYPCFLSGPPFEANLPCHAHTLHNEIICERWHSQASRLVVDAL